MPCDVIYKKDFKGNVALRKEGPKKGEPLSKQFQKQYGRNPLLEPVAPKLNEKSDALQAALKTTNEKLNELDLGL